MRLRRRDIRLVELDGRARKSALGLAALALQTRSRGQCSRNDIRFVVGFEVRINVRLLLCVGDAHRIGSGLGSFERVRHSQRNVLAVIAHNVILEWRPPLVGNALESRSLDRAEDFSNVLAMKNRAHAGHFLRRGSVEFDYFALCDRRFDWHAIEQSGKMEVGRVLRFPGHLQRPIHARGIAADG